MSGNLFMIDRCDVLRRGRSVQAYGGKPKYTAVAQDVPFRLITKNQKGFNSITAEWVTTTTYAGHFLSTVDIQEGDQLTNVVINRHGEQSMYISSEGKPHTFHIDSGVAERRGQGGYLKQVTLKRVN